MSSNPEDDEARHGPREMALIPFLLAKGHYEEVERMIRLILGHTQVMMMNMFVMNDGDEDGDD